MVEKENKGLMLGISAATALIGAALLYHYVSGDAEDDDTPQGIMAELQEAGLEEVKRNGPNLDPQYVCKMLNFVTVTGRKRRHDERMAAIAERREHYKNEDWAGYRRIVQEPVMAEGQLGQGDPRETMEVLTEMSEQEFQRTMQAMA